MEILKDQTFEKTFVITDENLALDIYLKGENAKCKIKVAATTEKSSDIKINVFHEADNTESDVYVKVLAKGGETHFTGVVIAPRHLKGIVAKEVHKALLLSDDAKVYAKPDLKVYTEHASAMHGSAIGSFDKKALFYLKTRGFPEKEAKKILADAFLKEITQPNV